MNVDFEYTPATPAEPIVFEQVFAEKPGGGMIKEPAYNAAAGTAVSVNSDGSFSLIKSYRLVEAVAADDTSIKIAKGSGIASGDVIGHNKKAVASTAVDTTTSSEYDTVTVTLGVAIDAGTVLYQALSASASSAAPKATPVFVIGNSIEGGKGDKKVRLVNGANLRKETAPLAPELAALLPGITLV